MRTNKGASYRYAKLVVTATIDTIRLEVQCAISKRSQKTLYSCGVRSGLFVLLSAGPHDRELQIGAKIPSFLVAILEM